MWYFKCVCKPYIESLGRRVGTVNKWTWLLRWATWFLRFMPCIWWVSIRGVVWFWDVLHLYICFACRKEGYNTTFNDSCEFANVGKQALCWINGRGLWCWSNWGWLYSERVICWCSLGLSYVAASKEQEVRAMALLLEKLQIQRNGDPKDVSCATRERVSCLCPEWQRFIA